MTKISVIALGGTIAMTDDGGPGVVPTLTGDKLVAAIPGLGDVADIQASTFRQIPGAHLSIDDLVALASEIFDHFRDGADGVVVTQGTDTIEETAFALDILVDSARPVIITGAMRNPTLPGADGPANLLASVVVASSPAASDIGAVVVLNDEIHAARFVRKTHTSNPSTFRSDPVGPIGWVAENTSRIQLRPARHPRIGVDVNAADCPVALTTLSLGDDGRLIEAAVAAGYSGIVVEALGGGHAAPGVAEMLGQAAREIPVVLCSRAGSGETLRRTYGFPGSETDLLGRGLIGSAFLDGPKARILLTLLLRSGAGTEAIGNAFAGYLDN